MIISDTDVNSQTGKDIISCKQIFFLVLVLWLLFASVFWPETSLGILLCQAHSL